MKVRIFKMGLAIDYVSHTNMFPRAVVRSESVRNIIRERRMLEHVNHPFICNLRYSFQDIEYMYACSVAVLSLSTYLGAAMILICF